MNRILLAACVTVCWGASAQQTVFPSLICDLELPVDEASGLEKLPNGNYLTHNDGGTVPELYIFDSTCTILRTIYLDSITNIDFEDVTMDSSGNVYIGDFGNNNTWHGRMDLKVFKIPPIDSIPTDTIVPEVINFSYSDQTNFAPPPASMIYDCEAMIWYGDSLYLFSKSESTATSPYTRVYSLSDQPGTYVAQLRDSLNTGARINAADLLGNTLILTANDYMWMVYNFTAPDWFGGTAQTYFFNPIKKYEGTKLISATRALLVNDSQTFGDTHLYELDLTVLGIEEEDAKHLSAFPNPAQNHVFIDFEEPGIHRVEVVSLQGARVKSISWESGSPIDVSDLNRGAYFISVNGSMIGGAHFLKL